MAGRHRVGTSQPRRFGWPFRLLLLFGIGLLIARIFFGVGAVHHRQHDTSTNGAAITSVCGTTVKAPSPAPNGSNGSSSAGSNTPCGSVETFAGDPGIVTVSPITVDYLCGVAVQDAPKLTQSEEDKLWGWCDNANAYADAGNVTDCMKQVAAIVREAGVADETDVFNPDSLADACVPGSTT